MTSKDLGTENAKYNCDSLSLTLFYLLTKIKADKGDNRQKEPLSGTGNCYFALSSDTVTMENPVIKKINLGLGNLVMN